MKHVLQIKSIIYKYLKQKVKSIQISRTFFLLLQTESMILNTGTTLFWYHVTERHGAMRKPYETGLDSRDRFVISTSRDFGVFARARTRWHNDWIARGRTHRMPPGRISLPRGKNQQRRNKAASCFARPLRVSLTACARVLLSRLRKNAEIESPSFLVRVQCLETVLLSSLFTGEIRIYTQRVYIFKSTRGNTTLVFWGKRQCNA